MTLWIMMGLPFINTITKYDAVPVFDHVSVAEEQELVALTRIGEASMAQKLWRVRPRIRLPTISNVRRRRDELCVKRSMVTPFHYSYRPCLARQPRVVNNC